MNRSKHPPLTEKQIKNIRQSCELYMRGQITLKEIAAKYKAPYQSVVIIQNKMMEEIINGKKN